MKLLTQTYQHLDQVAQLLQLDIRQSIQIRLLLECYILNIRNIHFRKTFRQL